MFWLGPAFVIRHHRHVTRRGEQITGEFVYEHPIEVRFVDTDAFGHVNNAMYLTYFEAARAGYYAKVTGAPFGTGAQAAERTFVHRRGPDLTYRAPAFFGETLLVGCRFGWTGKSSFGLEYRVRADESVVGAGAGRSPTARPSRSCSISSATA